MTDCELLFTCPFFNDSMYGMTEEYKGQYCKESYSWHGRYLIFNALEGELKRRSSFRGHQDRMEDADAVSERKVPALR